MSNNNIIEKHQELTVIDENRKAEVEEAVKEYYKGRLFDDVIEEVAHHNGFRAGVKWADTHLSKTIIEIILNMAFDGWDSISSFSDLAQSIKEEIQDGSYTLEKEEFSPFDVVIYKPTGERGLVKRVTKAGVFVLFRIQSTGSLCKPEDLEKE